MFTAIILGGFAIAYSQVGALVNPFSQPDPPEWSRAVQISQRVSSLPPTNSQKLLLEAMFSSLSSLRATFLSGNHPLSLRVSDFEAARSAYNADGKAYTDDLNRYKTDCESYKAAGGGGTYASDDPKLAMLQAWFARLTSWGAKLDAWKAKLDPEFNRLVSSRSSLTGDLQRERNNWVQSCANYAATADRVLKFAEVDDRIAKLKLKLDSDKRELDRYKSQVPGLHADIEKMALEAEQARLDGRMAAVDKAIGLALDGVVSKVGAREKTTRAKLRQVKDILIKHGVRPEDAKKVLKGWVDAPDSVQSIRHTREMLEQLGTLRDMAAALDSTTKQQYYEALVACLGVFVQTPVLKLAVSNFEIYSNLMYTGLSYATARARVNQYSKLADSELRAVAKISALYQKHVREMIELKKERERLAAQG
jgi:hypothetical protein